MQIIIIIIMSRPEVRINRDRCLLISVQQNGLKAWKVLEVYYYYYCYLKGFLESRARNW